MNIVKNKRHNTIKEKIINLIYLCFSELLDSLYEIHHE